MRTAKAEALSGPWAARVYRIDEWGEARRKAAGRSAVVRKGVSLEPIGGVGIVGKMGTERRGSKYGKKGAKSGAKGGTTPLIPVEVSRSAVLRDTTCSATHALVRARASGMARLRARARARFCRRVMAAASEVEATWI